MTEHQGMADELLCLYEQLGIVFEITRKLAGVQNESDVLDLFLVSLRRSFEGREVFAASRRARGWVLESDEPTEGQTTRPSDDATKAGASRRERPGGSGSGSRTAHELCGEGSYEVNEWLRGLLDRAESSEADRKVIVESAEGGGSRTAREPCGEEFTRGAMPGAIAEVMIAPVISGDVLVCSLVLLRTQQSPVFRASEMMLIESLTTFCGDLIRSHRLVGELREMSIAMVRALVNAVDQKDEYTCGHSLRVAYYATMLGKRLGLGEVDLQMLQWAALLHDVGKIGIRDIVLKKEGKLTP
ncbi:MAG: HD domain-containing protein, partial [candidate division NC10 bacterium]